MKTYKAIEMENYKDEPLQFVGVYVLRWRPEWGKPSIGFVEDDETESKLERLQRIEEAAKVVVSEDKKPYPIKGTPEGDIEHWHVDRWTDAIKALAAALEDK